MNIPYRHRRTLNRIGTVLLVLITIFAIAWLCWVVWLQRYVVYTDGDAKLDFSQSSYDITGKEAVPPKAEQNISIFYNEGADAINTSTDMTPIAGYYITAEMFQTDFDNVMLQVERLTSSTAVMVDMKGGYGSFYYESKLPDSVQSASTNIPQVKTLLDKLESKGFYTIARISAFRDYNFGLNHVPSGLYMLSRAGLWSDEGGYYWLDPTSSTTLGWVTDVVLELKELGFDEVVLDNFRFPNSTQYIFNGDKTVALQEAAESLMSTCSSSKFVLSFIVDDPTFKLPEGRCRMYLSDIGAASVSSTANLTGLEDPDIRVVFLSESGDTRYDDYSVLRTLYVAEEVEARKGNFIQ